MQQILLFKRKCERYSTTFYTNTKKVTYVRMLNWRKSGFSPFQNSNLHITHDLMPTLTHSLISPPIKPPSFSLFLPTKCSWIHVTSKYVSSKRYLTKRRKILNLIIMAWMEKWQIKSSTYSPLSINACQLVCTKRHLTMTISLLTKSFLQNVILNLVCFF